MPTLNNYGTAHTSVISFFKDNNNILCFNTNFLVYLTTLYRSSLNLTYLSRSLFFFKPQALDLNSLYYFSILTKNSTSCLNAFLFLDLSFFRKHFSHLSIEDPKYLSTTSPTYFLKDFLKQTSLTPTSLLELSFLPTNIYKIILNNLLETTILGKQNK